MKANKGNRGGGAQRGSARAAPTGRKAKTEQHSAIPTEKPVKDNRFTPYGRLDDKAQIMPVQKN